MFCKRYLKKGKAAIFICISFLLMLTACKKEEISYKVDYKTLNEAVYASGKIMPQVYDIIKSITNTKILKIEVKVGDTVHRGQSLVLLGSPSEQDQTNLLQQQVDIAKQQASGNSDVLKQLHAQILLAQQQYEQDRINANRYVALAKDTAVSQKDANDAVMKAKNSYTQWQNLKQEAEVKKQELNTRLLQAKSNMEAHRSEQFPNVLTSSINGVVFNINPMEGENVQVNTPIMLIGTPGVYKLELLVDERDIHQIKIGQEVLFQTDTYTHQQFKAKVTKINQVLQENNHSFKVDAEVLSDAYFYPQASVEANIIIRKEDKVLMIPSDFLLKGDSVWLLKGDKQLKVPVQTGIENDNWTVIKGGLKAGEIIVKKAS